MGQRPLSHSQSQFLQKLSRKHAHLYHNYVLGALSLDFRVLNLDGHCPPIMKYSLMDLG